MKCNRKDNLPVNQFQMINRFIYGRRGLFDVLGTSVTNVQKYERMTTKEITRVYITLLWIIDSELFNILKELKFAKVAEIRNHKEQENTSVKHILICGGTVVRSR